jgi:hypothetical protein
MRPALPEINPAATDQNRGDLPMTHPAAGFQTCAFPNNLSVAQGDPDLWAAILQEARRQEEHIELIASRELRQPAR